MTPCIHATPLYTFLSFCEKSPLPKVILDCGAGGACPPLYLFYNHGYETHGIEIDTDEIDKASEFSREKGIDMNIIHGDMLHIPFPDESFSFLYSYHTSVHMPKADFAQAVSEFHRVLTPGGLCFIDFLNPECDTYGYGTETGHGEYMTTEGKKTVLYTHYTGSEIGRLLHGFQIIRKEARSIHSTIGNTHHASGLYEYIVEKK